MQPGEVPQNMHGLTIIRSEASNLQPYAAIGIFFASRMLVQNELPHISIYLRIC